METSSRDEIGQPGTSIVCCIEAGILEEQSLRMLRTLRQNGGRLSRAHVMAVTPRKGATLSSKTKAEFRELDVEPVRDFRHQPLPWYNFANKIAAAIIAEKLASTPFVLWLDSDIIVAGEPTSCILEGDVDFAGRGEPFAPATRDGDLFEPFWKAACKVLGVDFASIPFIELESPHPPIRQYINGGVFAWRRGIGYTEAYRDSFIKLMASHLTPPSGDNSLNEQFCLSIAAHRLGLKFRHLDRRDNHFAFEGMELGPGGSLPLGDANLIHYSKSCKPEHWQGFIERIRIERPEMYESLVSLGPLRSRMSAIRTAVQSPFQYARAAQFKIHARRNIPVVDGTYSS